jgi:outer membrane protein assembly factor BamB
MKQPANSTPDFSFDVFVSYSRQDQSFVDWLCDVLERAGLRCFRDTTDLDIFDRLDAALKLNIGRARFLVAVISPAYLNSYWCMFEAMEAVQGEDREQRFLPLVLRYTPKDRSLDEDFVLSALEDLAKQIENFEKRLVTARAYELSAKLNKLNYVRGNLPRIFNQVQERLYPQLDLWDESDLRSGAKRLLRWLKPDVSPDLAWPAFKFTPPESTTAVIPTLDVMPKMIWSAQVGHCSWKNKALVSGDSVYIATAGKVWNAPDPDDGIRCLDAETGRQKWFVHTPADANSLLLTKGLLVTGCDDGTLVAVSAHDGKLQWSRKLGRGAKNGIVAGPLKLPITSMSQLHFEQRPAAEPILAITFSGTIFLVDLATGEELQHVRSNSRVIAEAILASGLVVSPTVDGTLNLIPFYDGVLQETQQIPITFYDDFDDTRRPAELCARPLQHNDLVLLSFARPTYYATPPIVAVDVRDRTVVWEASDPNKLEGDYGNLRAPPVMVGDEAVFAPAYSRGLSALSVATGAVTWTLDLGQGMFEQWSGPITDGAAVYLGRHDGYLHKVDTKLKRREWSLYLGAQSRAGLAVAGDHLPPEFDEDSSWLSANSAPILATPVLDRGRLYVGTSEGWLYCIGNLGP